MVASAKCSVRRFIRAVSVLFLLAFNWGSSLTRRVRVDYHTPPCPATTTRYFSKSNCSHVWR